MADCIAHSGTTPNPANGQWIILQKILCAINDGGGGGGGGGAGSSYGAGSPLNTVTPSGDGATYWNTSTVPNEEWQARGTTSADWIQVV